MTVLSTSRSMTVTVTTGSARVAAGPWARRCSIPATPRSWACKCAAPQRTAGRAGSSGQLTLAARTRSSCAPRAAPWAGAARASSSTATPTWRASLRRCATTARRARSPSRPRRHRPRRRRPLARRRLRGCRHRGRRRRPRPPPYRRLRSVRTIASSPPMASARTAGRVPLAMAAGAGTTAQTVGRATSCRLPRLRRCRRAAVTTRAAG